MNIFFKNLQESDFWRYFITVLTISIVGVLLSSAMFILLSIPAGLFLWLFNKETFIFGFIILVYIIVPLVILVIAIFMFFILKKLFNTAPDYQVKVGFVLSILFYLLFGRLFGSIATDNFLISLIQCIACVGVGLGIKNVYQKWIRPFENQS